MSEPIRVRFKQWECEVHRSKYGNGRTALVLIDAKDQEPIATATVNLPDEPLGPNEVFIKDWSENEGMLDVMEKAGIVKQTGGLAHSGYVAAPKCEIVHPDLVQSFEEMVREKTPSTGHEQHSERDLER